MATASTEAFASHSLKVCCLIKANTPGITVLLAQSLEKVYFFNLGFYLKEFDLFLKLANLACFNLDSHSLRLKTFTTP